MASASQDSGRKPVDRSVPKAPRGKTKPVKRSSGGSTKKPGAKKSGARQTAAKKNKSSSTKKSGANRSAGKKSALKKPAGKKSALKKPAGKKGDGGPSNKADKTDKADEATTVDAASNAVRAVGSADSIANVRVRTLLARPDSSGPRVTLGLAWFVVAVAAVFLGRWAVAALWGTLAAFAAAQVGRVWAAQPKAEAMPGWAPVLGAVGAAVCVAASTVGTALGGVALLASPILLVVAVTVAGRKPVDASGAAIGLVLAAIPAMSMVLLSREGWEVALFVLVAVSFYDAGFFIGAAESSSRLEGPVTGAIGLLAVTFAASAFEAAPFDRITAWVAGAVMVLACPLGQILVSAELPSPESSVPAMRRLDSYLVSVPLMLAAVWALS